MRSFKIGVLAIAIAASAAPIIAMAQKPAVQMNTTTTGQTADGRGVEIVHTGAMDFIDVEGLVRQARDEFARLYPDQTAQTMVQISIGEDGRLTVHVLPYGSGLVTMEPGGDPPPLPGPPPGYPGTGNSVTRVDYHQFQNGYNRDTSYSRDHEVGPGGEIVNGSWWVSSDHVDYVGGGGGSTGCGGSGQRPCPKKD